MTRYLVIFTAVLIGRVVGPPYGQYWCPLPGDADSENGVCEHYEEANAAYDGDDDDLCKDDSNTGDSLECQDLVTDCTPGWCKEDCDCDGDKCDRKCYFGCQFEDTGLIQPDRGDHGRRNYCNEVRAAWLESASSECGDDCGICAEPWCAQLDVIEGDALTSGSCKRDIQTWQDGELVCTKSMIDECDAQTYNDYRLLHACHKTCGYPHQCGDGRNSTWNPIKGKTNFAELCTSPTSNFKLKRGSCEDQREPPTCDGYHAGGTHILRWNVMRLPTFMCDPDCGMQEGRFTWGRCAHLHGDPLQDKDNMCFAVTDGSGMDIGPCEIQSAGAQVFDCNGKNICECDEPEDYEPVQKYTEKKPYVAPTSAYKSPQVYSTEYAYDAANDDATDSASTYTVLSVAGIALAHAML